MPSAASTEDRPTHGGAIQEANRGASSDVPRFESRRAHHFPYKSSRYGIEAGGSESLGASHGGADGQGIPRAA